jgi:hypothetical protein
MLVIFSEIWSFLVAITACCTGHEDCNNEWNQESHVSDSGVAELFIGETLHLRGPEPVVQQLVSASGSVLVYNGNNALKLDVMLFPCPTVIYMLN